MQEQENINNENGLPIEAEPLPETSVMHRKFLWLYDDDFIFIPGSEDWYDVPEGETLPNSTETEPPNYYKARFNPQTHEWYESATLEEIAILNKGRYGEPTNEDLLMLQIAELYEENLQQQSFNDAVSMAIADLYERGLQ